MKKQKGYMESFETFLAAKGAILAVAGLLVLAYFAIRWVGVWWFLLPYKWYGMIGMWGILLGGLIMFLLANIPAGIILVLLRVNEDNIMFTEMVLAITCGFTMLIAWIDVIKLLVG